jgi:crotonobetainyl-CoA:carnitine CoA-transferase CaiB-like acyl-CoA transferase
MQPVKERPLAGVQVLSFAEQFPGPYACLILGDLGAEVVQVERPDGGDPARRFPGLYDALNRGKKSAALDLKDPRAVAACVQLARSSDVVLEGFRPGVMARLGLGADVLLTANPALVHVSISGFGQCGPYKDRPGHDLSYQALAGTLTAPANAQPGLPALTLADLVSGIFGAVACLTGLAAAQRSGVGGRYDVSMFDSLVSMMTVPLVGALNGYAGPSPGADPGYGVFPTSDGGWIALAVAYEDPFWRRICDVLGLEQHVALGHAERAERREELTAALAAALLSKPATYWDAVLGDADVPFGLLRSPAALLADTHFAARRLVTEVADGTTARRYVRQPLTVDGQPLGPRTGPPLLGEHTASVLRRAGLDTDLAPQPGTG